MSHTCRYTTYGALGLQIIDYSHKKSQKFILHTHLVTHIFHLITVFFFKAILLVYFVSSLLDKLEAATLSLRRHITKVHWPCIFYTFLALFALLSLSMYYCHRQFNFLSSSTHYCYRSCFFCHCPYIIVTVHALLSPSINQSINQ